MKRLILTRHAKSSWDDPLMNDHDRPLNERGKMAAADLGAADWNCASAFSSWPVARYSSPSSFVAWAFPALAAASKSGCGPWAGSDVGDGMGAIAWLTNHSRYLVTA